MDKRKSPLLTFLKRKWWYLTLLIASTSYVYVQRNSIGIFSEFTVQNLIFYIWLMLLLFPLFSEMEFMGVKLKKEVERAAKDVKESITDLKMQVMDVKFSNSFANSLSFTFSGDAPSKQELAEIANDDKPNSDAKNKLSMDDIVTDDVVYLFKVRLTLERALKTFSDHLNYDGRHSILQLLNCAVENGMLDRKNADYTKQIITICNRGIHGEIVSDEYMEFVKSVLPQVLGQINSITSRMGYKYYFVCPRCKYAGYSKYENVCPSCGFVSDDE